MNTLKSKRIKKVFGSSYQVIHLWANQTQTDARSSNVFFEGKSIYSYGYHYELGRMEQINGVTVALINAKGYSNTTNKHIYNAWYSVSHIPRLKCFDGDFDIESALIENQGKLVDKVFNMLNQRSFYSNIKKDIYLNNEIKEFNELCIILKRKDLTIELTEETISLINSHIKKCIDRNRELDAIKNDPETIRKKQELALKKAIKQIESWRLGGPLVESVRKLRPMLLRVHNNEVHTSGGASVPLDHAIRLLSLIERKQAKNGTKVGHFTVSSVNKEVVTIGCHTIALNEARTVLKGIEPKLKLVTSV